MQKHIVLIFYYYFCISKRILTFDILFINYINKKEKPTMKKAILAILCAISATVTMAQTNPKSGYVITNSGDTIRGIIDLRTNERLSKQCEFWANGEKEGKTYKPGDIEGFRFDNNGKYFVSRRLNVTGEPGLYFAEYMVQGKMNLYCVAYSQNEYFFFEREDGEMALLSNKTMSFTSNSEALASNKTLKQKKQEEYGKVKLLLKDSGKAVVDMDDEYLTRKKLVNVVRDYHNDVCTDGSHCMVYEYNDKNDKGTVHFKGFASFQYYSSLQTGNQAWDDANYTGATYEIGLGMEFDFERVAKGFSAEFDFGLTPKYSSTDNIKAKLTNVTSRYDRTMLNFSLGAVKRFGTGKIQPLIRGGLFVVLETGLNEKLTYSSSSSTIRVNEDWENCLSHHYGLYLGGGVQIPAGKHAVRVHADFYKGIEKSQEMNKFGLTAEFIL